MTPHLNKKKNQIIVLILSINSSKKTSLIRGVFQYHQYLDFVLRVCLSFALTERCPVSTYTAINPTSYCSTFTAITDSDCFKCTILLLWQTTDE